MEPIGFNTPNKEPQNEMRREIDMLKKRVEALEKNDGNYQQYLKLKEQFEK